MAEQITDVWEVMSTSRTIRRFTDDPVDDATLARCLEAATWAPSGANAQGWRFIVLRSPEQRAVVAQAAARALEVIEPVYGMTRPGDDDDSRRARTNRATYELHDRAGEFTSILFAQQRYPSASELLLGGSIFPAMQNFCLLPAPSGSGPASPVGPPTAASHSFVRPSGCRTTGCSPGMSSSVGPGADQGRSAAGPWPTSYSSTTGTSRPADHRRGCGPSPPG